MTKTLRCAVYTRKSSEEGLDQSFNSLDAQREACEAYIKSQAHEGWRLVHSPYDDGGLSGGSLERPGLKRLLVDIEQGLIDVIVVYKVDRLTRSLTDFAKIVESLDAKAVSFVSVTQQFNTTSSMGRLTLNVLLSFAQFEREVTGERIRDKFLASRKKGMWMGGYPPLGYDIINRHLAVNQAEAKQLMGIFKRFLAVKTVAALAADLKAKGIRSKRWTTIRGSVRGGEIMSRGAIYHLLRNRVYLGDAVHKDQVYRGEQQAIVPKALFDSVQAKLAPAAHPHQRGRRQLSGALLKGVLFDDRGNLMSPSHATKRGGTRYRYYVSQALLQYRTRDAGSMPRIPAPVIEGFVERQIRALAPTKLVGPDVLRGMIRRVELARDAVTVTLGMRPDPIKLAAFQQRSARGEAIIKSSTNELTLRLRIHLRSWGGEKVIEAPAAPDRTHIYKDATLIKGLVRAHRWRSILLGGKVATLNEIAQQHDCTQGYVGRVLKLSLLAPDIVAAILAGRQPRSMTLATLFARIMPLSWREQRMAFGFSSR